MQLLSAERLDCQCVCLLNRLINVLKVTRSLAKTSVEVGNHSILAKKWPSNATFNGLIVHL